MQKVIKVDMFLLLNLIFTFFSEFIHTSGKSINHGTYDSVVSAIANWRRLGSVLCNTKEKFFTRPYFPRYQLKKHILPQRDQILKKWTMPFWDTDKWVVRRTQMIRYSKNPQDYPVQFEPYM